MNARLCCVALIFAGAVAPFFTGCATVTRGTSEVLVIESEPSGANVRMSNGMVGTTPTSFKIPRKGSLVVNIEKEGYEPLTVNVHTQVAGAGAAGMAGNVLVGGLIGVGIDSFSGGMLEHKPNPVRATLVPLNKNPPVAVALVTDTSTPAATTAPVLESTVPVEAKHPDPDLQTGPPVDDEPVDPPVASQTATGPTTG